MAQYDVTAVGSKLVFITALFPAGMTISEGSDDVPLFDVVCTPFGDVTAGVNGDGISHKMPSVYTITVGVIANSPSDKNLRKVTAMNRPQGNGVTIDFIQCSYVEPDGTSVAFANLTQTNGALANRANPNGKFETRVYEFKGVTQVL